MRYEKQTCYDVPRTCTRYEVHTPSEVGTKVSGTAAPCCTEYIALQNGIFTLTYQPYLKFLFCLKAGGETRPHLGVRK